jgi:hypothetical protein
MMLQHEPDTEVKLYRWPWGPRQQFVTKRMLFFRVFVYAGTIGLAFFLGVFWATVQDTSSRVSHIESVEKDAIKQCCVKDVRTAQEALTKLSVDAQKLRVRISGIGKNGVTTEAVSYARSVEERARLVWDQLESLLQDSDEPRRKLRDIRINLEGLKEQFQTAEVCCAATRETLPVLRQSLQTAERRFQIIQARVSPAYIEGDMNVADAVQEAGYSYVIKQDFDTDGDTTDSPKASKLKLYEDGLALGPAHSNHAEIRQYGRGRYSHWGNALYFSSSDNSDPTTNKRRYTYRSYSDGALDPASPPATLRDPLILK